MMFYPRAVTAELLLIPIDKLELFKSTTGCRLSLAGLDGSERACTNL